MKLNNRISLMENAKCIIDKKNSKINCQLDEKLTVYNSMQYITKKTLKEITRNLKIIMLIENLS
jgi:hypothetical protein